MGAWAVLGRATAAFTVTNVDAFVVLTLLFASSRSTGVPRPAQILAGQCPGFAAWVSVSVLTAAGLRLVPDVWVGLLCLLPIALGVHGLRRARHRDPTYVPATGTLSMAGLTAAKRRGQRHGLRPAARPFLPHVESPRNSVDWQSPIAPRPAG